MTRRQSIAIVMAAAMLALGTAADARAQQDTSRTSTRIRVQKDRTYGTAGGAVAVDSAAIRDSLLMAAQRDSIARAEQMRQDSIMRVEQMRRDSIAAVERARQDSIMRVEQARRDSIARAEEARLAAERAWFTARGFYIGIAGGASMPQGDFDDGYDTGFNITIPMGWQRPLSPLGVRLDLSYDNFNGAIFDDVSGPIEFDDATVWSAILDAKWQLAFGQPDLSTPVRRRTGLYLLGGGGVHRFADFGSDAGDETALGLNGGAGFQWGWGMNTVFLEARYISAFTDVENANYIPVILGITF
jgi:hypothetical protein